MAVHAEQQPQVQERLELGARARTLLWAAGLAGVVALAASLLLGTVSGGGIRRFYFAYLVSFAFFLSLGLGGLFFVLLQHLTRAAWSVSVRRVAECLAATLPVMGILSAPILVSVAMQKGDLYPWALPLSAATPEAIHAAETGADVEETPAAAESKTAKPSLDVQTLRKRAMLNPVFFITRVTFYFLIWSALGLWYWLQSTKQDQTGDPNLTLKMQKLAGAGLVILGVTLTFASFDLFMSLDPHWYSTMFGVYYFSGAAVAVFAAIILVAFLLQRAGYIQRSVTIEHYHDLGKFLFGFVFFWGYIAFSQYMLLWYAQIPETVKWLSRRGATTVSSDITGWSHVAIALLVGNLLIPFAGLLSRHVKRNKAVLAFWAVWLLAFHWVDLYWLIMPEYSKQPAFGLIDVAALLGIGGVFVAALLRFASQHALRPAADPRLDESLALKNL